jgi:glycosyltransferase involved in cell wall biosynthesis
MSATISVCMATYNGASFVAEQIASILPQLGPEDELVVVDDASSDQTVAVVRSVGDERVRVHQNDHNVGYVQTFERALGLAHGDLIFLADQDDVWPEGRVATMVRALDRGAVVAGNLAILGGPSTMRGPFGEKDWRIDSAASGHTLRNLVRLAASDIPYFGSAMAVRREVLDLALPFPASVRELHDGWLALLGLMLRSMVHVDDRVVLRRLHEGNTTGRIRSPWTMLRGRLLFLAMCAAAWSRVRTARASETADTVSP